MRTRKNTNSPTKRRILAAIVAEHGTTCAVTGCGRVTIVGGSPLDGMTFNLGHVTSESNGGEFITANLLPICRRCNAEMGESDWAPEDRTREPRDLPLGPVVASGEVNMEPGPLSRK